MPIEKITKNTGIFVDERYRYSGADMVEAVEQFFERLKDKEQRWLDQLANFEVQLAATNDIIFTIRTKQFEAVQRIQKDSSVNAELARLESELDEQLIDHLGLHELVPLKHRSTVLDSLKNDIGNALGCLRQLRDAMAEKNVLEVSFWAHELGAARVMLYVRPFEPNAWAGAQTTSGGRKAAEAQFGTEEARKSRKSKLVKHWRDTFAELTERQGEPPACKQVDFEVGKHFGIGPKATSRIRVDAGIRQRKKSSKK